MIGFATASFRENKVNGLLAQGLGTSMLQIGNIVKNPLIWLPAIHYQCSFRSGIDYGTAYDE